MYFHSLSLITASVHSILVVVNGVLAISVRASVNKGGMCPIERDQELYHHHAELDEKVDRHAVTTRSYGRCVHDASWCWYGGTASQRNVQQG